VARARVVCRRREDEAPPRPIVAAGKCFLEAGFVAVGTTKEEGHIALQLRPRRMPGVPPYTPSEFAGPHRFARVTAPRPVLRYHGGKWRLAPWVIAHFPPHGAYVEPFGGGGSVLMRKPRAKLEVYNDLDADVVNVFRVLRNPDQSARLTEQLRLTPWSRREFELSYERSDDPVEQARRTIARTFMGHGTTSRRKNRTGFRGGIHRGQERPIDARGGGCGDWPTYHEQVAAFVERLSGVVIEEAPALHVIDRYDGPSTLFYVDPPYPLETRTSIRWPAENDRCYAHDMTDDDHRRLAATQRRCEAAVIVSGYPCALYDLELFRDWERDQRDARADRGVAKTEVLWMKPAGVTLPAPAKSYVQHSLELAQWLKDASFPARFRRTSSSQVCRSMRLFSFLG
jgi:DNA adenine methylase